MDKKVILFNMFFITICVVILEIVLNNVSKNSTFSERKLYNIQYCPSAYANVWMKPNQEIRKYNHADTNHLKLMYKINDRGLRGRNINLKKAQDEIRIAIIGGSHVFDINCYDYENCPGFPAIIEKNLSSLSKPISVINIGIPGANSNSYLTIITLELSVLKPDIVIINSIWNDLKWISNYNYTEPQLLFPPNAIEKNPMIEPVNGLDNIFGRSIIYRKIRDQYWKHKLKKHLRGDIIEGIVSNKSRELTDFNKGYEQYKNNIEACIELTKSINAIPILAIEERFVSHNNDENSKKRISYHMLNVKSHFELVSMYETCDSILYTSPSSPAPRRMRRTLYCCGVSAP